MPLLALIVTHLAKVAHWIGRAFEGAALLLTDMLPALLPPATLTKLIRTHYECSYNDADTSQGRPCGRKTMPRLKR